jgi:hypothetical protein
MIMSSLSISAADLVRVIAVFFCSGIFWMMVLYLVEQPARDRRTVPGSVPLAVTILLIAAVLLVDMVMHADAVSFLVPPP